MALAVKNMPETTSERSLNRLAVGSIAGTLYVLASLGIVFYGLPQLWSLTAAGALTASVGFSVSTALLILVMIAAATGLGWLGTRLVGPRPVPGLKAGIFLGILGLGVIAVLTDWIGLILQGAFYNQHQLFGAASRSVGLGMTAGIGIVLLGFGIRLVFRPGFERWARRLEEQGWFDVISYKRSQGQRVRRGTMLGVMVLAGCGIYTLLAHRALETGPRNWDVAVPFTGNVTITDPGDATVLNPALDRGATVDPFSLRNLNDQLLADYVRIAEPGDSDFNKGQVAPRSEFQKAVERFKNENPPTAEPPLPPNGDTTYATLTILPDIRFTVPILLAVVALWFSWRLVNYPPFADFLIATEAELNKVSWTTRKRLIQDTTVVLVMVVLLTVFLFVVDFVWVQAFQAVGVLQKPSATEKKENQLDW